MENRLRDESGPCRGLMQPPMTEIRGTGEKVAGNQIQDVSCRESQQDLLMANLMIRCGVWKKNRSPGLRCFPGTAYSNRVDLGRSRSKSSAFHVKSMERSCRPVLRCLLCFALFGPGGVTLRFSPAYLLVTQTQLWRKQTMDPWLGFNRTNGQRVKDIGKRSSEMIDNWKLYTWNQV